MNRKVFLRNAGLLALASPGFLKGKPAIASDRNIGDTQVINAGISGNTTKNLLARIQEDCLSHQPSLVIMMIGTNDMNNGKYVPIGKFESNLTALTGQIQSSGSKLLIMTILPFYVPYLLSRHPATFFEPEGPLGRRKAVNEVIEKVAKQNNATFLDVGSMFEKVGKVGLDKDSLIRNDINSGHTDGVHPTPNGYRFLALAVSHFVLSRGIPCDRIVCFGDSITRGDGSIDKESYPAYLKKLL